MARLALKQELAVEYRDLLPGLQPDEWRRVRGEQDIIVRYEPEKAIAALPKLLEYASELLAPRGACLFLQGRTWRAELTRAAETWKMRATPIPSRSDPTGVVLRIDDLSQGDDR